MDNIVILFTMEGCPFCQIMKDKLKESDIEYHERDIDENEEEYSLFSEVSGSDFVPAFMIISDPETSPNAKLFAPEKDFFDLDEGIVIIKEHLNKG